MVAFKKYRRPKNVSKNEEEQKKIVVSSKFLKETMSLLCSIQK